MRINGKLIYEYRVYRRSIIFFLIHVFLPIIPVYIGYFAEANPDEKTYRWKIVSKPMLKAAIFVLGLSTAFVLLGFGAGALGSLLYSDGFIRIAVASLLLGCINWTTKDTTTESRKNFT